MKNMIISALGLALAAQLAATPAQAQQPTVAGPAMAQEDTSAQSELMQVQRRLMTAEQQALQDPAVAALQKSMQASLEKEMARVSPDFEQKIQRLATLQTEVQMAMKLGDRQQAQALALEGRGLQAELMTAQAEAMKNEQLASEVLAFQEQVRAKMLEVEPETEALIARSDALVGQLQASTSAR